MWSRNKKRTEQKYKNKDAVRRCIKGYECRFIAKEKLKHIVSKEAFNIDGFGKKVIEQFWDLGLIKEPVDIFKLDYKKIEILEGWGKLSINNLKKAITKIKKFLWINLFFLLALDILVKKMQKFWQVFLEQ